MPRAPACIGLIFQPPHESGAWRFPLWRQGAATRLFAGPKRVHAVINERNTMVSIEENKLLTQVGPGTPGGELLRRYW